MPLPSWRPRPGREATGRARRTTGRRSRPSRTAPPRCPRRRRPRRPAANRRPRPGSAPSNHSAATTGEGPPGLAGSVAVAATAMLAAPWLGVGMAACAGVTDGAGRGRASGSAWASASAWGRGRRRRGRRRRGRRRRRRGRRGRRGVGVGRRAAGEQVVRGEDVEPAVAVAVVGAGDPQVPRRAGERGHLGRGGQRPGGR